MTSFDRDFEEQLKEDVKILLNSYPSIDNLLTLIDIDKKLLAYVDQAPSKSMQDALLPSMKALVANELCWSTLGPQHWSLMNYVDQH